MQAFTTQGLSARPVTPGLYNRTILSNRRTARTVVARAAQGDAQESREEKVVNKVVVSAISAFAAASLALTGSVSATGIVPRNAAPDLSIAKDDDLLGKAFQKAGVPGNGDKAADALRDKTPGVDAKSSAGQAKGAVSDALRKAQNAAPDLSAGKDDDLLGKAFQKAGVPGNADKAADALRSKTPGVGSGGGQAKGAVDDAARKVSQKVGGR